MSLTPVFVKSTFSDPQGCVEVRKTEDAVEVRNSRIPNGGTLTFTTHEWEAFVKGTKQGEFDIS